MSFKGIETEAEKQLWEEACVFFDDLLNELNLQNLLRKGISHKDREKLFLILNNCNYHKLALNDMSKRFESEKTLLEFATKSGLSSQTLTYAFLAQLTGTALLNYETVLKTSLLFFLKEEKGITRRMTLGQLLTAIKDNTSTSIQERLTRMIDTDMRNWLAHGTFWYKEAGQKVCWAENSYLEKADEMPFIDFLIKLKKLGVISCALSYVLDKKILAGYFRP